MPRLLSHVGCNMAFYRITLINVLPDHSGVGLTPEVSLTSGCSDWVAYLLYHNELGGRKVLADKRRNSRICYECISVIDMGRGRSRS